MGKVCQYVVQSCRWRFQWSLSSTDRKGVLIYLPLTPPLPSPPLPSPPLSLTSPLPPPKNYPRSLIQLSFSILQVPVFYTYVYQMNLLRLKAPFQILYIFLQQFDIMSFSCFASVKELLCAPIYCSDNDTNTVMIKTKMDCRRTMSWQVFKI